MFKQSALNSLPELLSSIKKLFLPILFSLCVFSNVNAQSAVTVNEIHIVTPSWNNITNEDGTGLYFDIVRKVYQPFGIKISYEIVPWERAVKMIKEHEADAMLGGYYISREGIDDLFPLYPIGAEILCLLCKKGKLSKWEGQNSLDGKKIVWIRGYNYDKYLNVIVDWQEIDHEEQGWKLIDSGRFDFYMENINVLNKYIKKMNVDMKNYDIHIVYTKNLFARFANTPKSKQLIEIYDSRMPALIDSGEIKSLFDKWGFPYPSFVARENTP